MRFKLYDTVYDTGRIDDIPLRDVMLFNSQAEQMGLPERWHDIERITLEISKLGKKGHAHPDSMLMFGVTVWACRRLNGEDVTLDEATNVPLSAIEVLAAPKDRQPSRKPNARKKAQQKKRPARKASPAGAGARAGSAAAQESTTPLTSPTESASD